MSETGNSNRIREHYSDDGYRLFRNNCGALPDRSGRLVRFGLANDSKALNETIKSGDLIGYRSRLVTPDMVGDVIAVFVSIEAKENGWSFPRVGPIKTPRGGLSDYGHAVAQLRWADMVRAEGGEAGFMIDPLRGFEPTP